MQNAISTNKLYITGTETDEHTVSIETIAILKVKGLMQKTHPDKATGYEFEFKQMKQCSDCIKSGIPLPTPTHTAGDKVKITLTFPK